VARSGFHDANGRSLAESDRELKRPKVAVDALFDEFERLKLPRLDAVGIESSTAGRIMSRQRLSRPR